VRQARSCGHWSSRAGAAARCSPTGLPKYGCSAPEGSGQREFETHAENRPVQLEFGNLMFLQELNQLLQIVNIFWIQWISSFLNSPTRGGSGVLDTPVQSSIRALAPASAPALRFVLLPQCPQCESRTDRQVNSRSMFTTMPCEQPGCLSGANPCGS